MEVRVNNVTTYTPCFQARNPVIRRADDLARMVAKNFQLVSSSKLNKFKNSNHSKFSNMHERINEKIYASRMSQKKAVMENADDFVAFKKFSDVLKKTNAGNCGEFSMLTCIIAKMNNINNVKIVNLRSTSEKYFNKVLDHSVVLVKDKKPYIIDAWLGFADYVPNAIQRYKSEFSGNFDKKLLHGKNISFVERNNLQDFIFNEFAENDYVIKNMKELHPEWLLQTQNKSQINPR